MPANETCVKNFFASVRAAVRVSTIVFWYACDLFWEVAMASSVSLQVPSSILDWVVSIGAQDSLDSDQQHQIEPWK